MRSTLNCKHGVVEFLRASGSFERIQRLPQAPSFIGRANERLIWIALGCIKCASRPEGRPASAFDLPGLL